MIYLAYANSIQRGSFVPSNPILFVGFGPTAGTRGSSNRGGSNGGDSDSDSDRDSDRDRDRDRDRDSDSNRDSDRDSDRDNNQELESSSNTYESIEQLGVV